MSVTSSNTRRPFGKPAGSPPSRPRRLTARAGRRRRRRRCSAAAGRRPARRACPARRSAARRSRAAAGRCAAASGSPPRRAVSALSTRASSGSRKKLRTGVVLRLVHAEAVLRTGADEQLVDQRVAHALHLAERAGADGGQRRAAHGQCVAATSWPTRRSWRRWKSAGSTAPVRGQQRDRHFDRDGVHRVAGDGVGREVHVRRVLRRRQHTGATVRAGSACRRRRRDRSRTHRRWCPRTP